MPIVYILMTGCTRHLHIFCNNSYNCLLLIYRTIHFEFKTQYRHLVDRTYEGVGWSDWKAYGISHIHISWLSRQTDVLGLVTFSVRTILHTLLDTQPRTSISWLNHDLARHGYHISKLMLRQGGRTNEGRLITVNKQCRLLIEGEGEGDTFSAACKIILSEIFLTSHPRAISCFPCGITSACLIKATLDTLIAYLKVLMTVVAAF